MLPVLFDLLPGQHIGDEYLPLGSNKHKASLSNRFPSPGCLVLHPKPTLSNDWHRHVGIKLRRDSNIPLQLLLESAAVKYQTFHVPMPSFFQWLSQWFAS